jgi:hypothetical protein
VLESLVKRGLPSPAEETDAAMSGRAECAMLNKGPHILLALDFLCDVLSRMKGIRPRDLLSCAWQKFGFEIRPDKIAQDRFVPVKLYAS